MNEPGRLIAKGRAADVYELPGGRVLRRYRETPAAGWVEREAAVMRHARAHGVSVPEVFDAAGTDMVMERLGGRSLVDHLARRPWGGHGAGALLARLHRSLETLPAPEGVDLPVAGEGSNVIHRDFHPANVMVDGDDAYVIDWSNVAIGSPALDHAITWSILATAEVDDVPRLVRPVVDNVRRILLTSYLSGIDREAAAAWVRAACDMRIADPNSRPLERQRLDAFAAQVAAARR